MKYALLQVRSTYSTGRAIGTSEEIFSRAKEIGLHTVGIADLSTLSGVLDFYQAGRKSKSSFTLGTSIRYFDEVEGSDKTFRITLIAKDQTGYRNLCRLTTLSNRLDRRIESGPRVTVEDIADYREGLICLFGDIDGPYRWDQQSYSNSRVNRLKSIFKDDLYCQIFLHIFYEKETEVIQLQNKHLLHLCDLQGIQPIISCDAYMETSDQKTLHDIVLVNSYGEPSPYPRWMMSMDDIRNQIGSFHQYIDDFLVQRLCENSVAAAEKCNKIQLEFKPQIVNYPHLLHPLNDKGYSKVELVMRIIQQNGRVDLTNQIYRERLLHELKAITQNGRIDLIDYFLVLEDLCRWCRDNGIVVGPGRGSGAGSLINYGLRITHLDPIRYGLLFERFISEGRIQKGTLPDVDIDFSDQERVRGYLIEKYGDERVKPIGVMQTLRLKNAIKDTFKALYPDVSFVIVNNATKVLPKQEQEESELEYFDRCLLESKELSSLLKEFSEVEKSVRRLVGYNRQAGVHPCGMAITQDPLEEFSPMRYLKDKWVLEYGADDAAFSGIIKYDILSVKTLQYFDGCFKLIKQHRGIDIDLENIPIDDRKTFDAFEAGDTESVFQFNSEVAKSILTKIKITSIDDLSLVTSVGRPGPMVNGQHIEFIQRKNGVNKPLPPHHSLQDTLKDSYGIMIYQEGVMKASQILGGFSLAEADDIRKAMGKKDSKYLKPYKDRFIQNASKYWIEGAEVKTMAANMNQVELDMALEQLVSEGYYLDISPQRAEEIWHLMETFSGYGFNKSHSMSYALIGYFCQYLKVHYPLEWWTACMKAAGDDHMALYYEAAKNYIKKPDINESNDTFEIKNSSIQMPLSVVKGIGEAASAEIVKCRPFSSLKDFFDRVNKTRVNKKVVQQLIFGGCFDRVHPDLNRNQLIELYYTLRKEEVPEEIKCLDKSKIADYEHQALNFVIPDYSEIYPDIFKNYQYTDVKRLTKAHENSLICLGGRIDEVKPIKFTSKKTGKEGIFYRLSLFNAGVVFQAQIWPDEWNIYSKGLEKNDVVLLRGTLSFYRMVPQLKVTTVININKDLKGQI